MKARVKATGKIVDVYESCNEDFPWTDEMGDKVWKTEELIFLETTDNTPDYWTRLEHQAAIAAMQGTLANADLLYSLCKDRGDCPVKVVVIEFANACAHALVEKMKEEK